MNAPRRKGTAAETAVVDYLHGEGYPHVERRALRGKRDQGDIAGIPGLVIEVKAEREATLAKYVDEATEEALNAGASVGVVWHKRRGHASPGAWYVTMNGVAFVELLDHWTGKA